MPKRGMFRKDKLHGGVPDKEMVDRAFAGLYALHGYLFVKEAKAKKKSK